MTAFAERVFAVVRAIPEGHVLTYGDVATLCGAPRAARAAGSALRQCPPDVPWHRVTNAQGAVSFRGDVHRAQRQRQRLTVEGVVFDSRGRFDLSRVRWDGDGAPTFFDDPHAPPDDWDDVSE